MLPNTVKVTFSFEASLFDIANQICDHPDSVKALVDEIMTSASNPELDEWLLDFAVRNYKESKEIE